MTLSRVTSLDKSPGNDLTQDYGGKESWRGSSKELSFFSERNFTSGDWRFCSWSFSCLHTKGPLIWNRGRFIHLEVSRLAFYSPGACVPDKTGTGLRDISSHQGLVTPGRTDKMLVLSHVMLVELLTNICGAAILM